MTDAKKDYQSAYHTLQSAAERLENDPSIDIDELGDIVQEAIAAYKVCKERIDAVQKILNDAFLSIDSTDLSEN